MTHLMSRVSSLRENWGRMNELEIKGELSRLSRHLTQDVMSKHDGEFMSYVLSHHPYWSKKINLIRSNYFDLLSRLSGIIVSLDNSRKEEVEAELASWENNLMNCQSNENCLIWDSVNLDHGCEHT